MKQSRSYLFLQSVCSPFFARLADSLRARGHAVHKINFNAGDVVYWGRRPASNFHGNTHDLSSYLSDHFRQYGITDQVLFGDRRPVHRVSIDCARAHGVRTHVYEEGYFRPYWVTLEREGVNGHSSLPRDPQWYLEVGKRLPDLRPVRSFQSSFGIRAIHDVIYHSAGFWNSIFFSRYRTHAPTNAASEYLAYLQRLPWLRFHKRRDDALIDDLLGKRVRFFFLPLQLASDAQILDHSKFPDMVSVLQLVMESFAIHAPKESSLLIKNHPLDTGAIHYRRVIGQLAHSLGIENRMLYVETGDLNAILRHAQGTVTVNSTVGALSLATNCPTIALGAPIYDLPGLTFQEGLDKFWQGPHLPDAELFRCFRNTVIHTTQVNGGFYSREGIALAVQHSCRPLESEHSPLAELT